MTQDVPDLSQYVSLDCEASGLEPPARTFPVSVGLCFPDLTTCHWLIRPIQEWLDWRWDPAAQAIHGLDRDTLTGYGLPVEQVARKLTDAVGDRICVSDSPHDLRWIRTLYRATGQPKPPIRHEEWFDALATVAKTKTDNPTKCLALIDDAVNEANRRQPMTHRADSDAQTNMLELRLLAGLDR